MVSLVGTHRFGTKHIGSERNEKADLLVSKNTANSRKSLKNRSGKLENSLLSHQEKLQGKKSTKTVAGKHHATKIPIVMVVLVYAQYPWIVSESWNSGDFAGKKNFAAILFSYYSCFLTNKSFDTM